MIKWNKKVTIKDLERHNACSMWKANFNKCFPKGAVLNLKNLKKFYKFCRKMAKDNFTYTYTYPPYSLRKAFNHRAKLYFKYSLRYLISYMRMDSCSLENCKNLTPSGVVKILKNKNNYYK